MAAGELVVEAAVDNNKIRNLRRNFLVCHLLDSEQVVDLVNAYEVEWQWIVIRRLRLYKLGLPGLIVIISLVNLEFLFSSVSVGFLVHGHALVLALFLDAVHLLISMLGHF